MWGHFLPRDGKRVGSLRKGDQLVEVISDKWHIDGVCFLIVISLLYTPVTSYVLVLPQFGCCKEGKKTVYQVPRHYIGDSLVALVVKNLPANVGDIRDKGSIPGSGRSSGGGHGNPLQCSCLENPMDREAWRAMGHKFAESDTTEVS